MNVPSGIDRDKGKCVSRRAILGNVGVGVGVVVAGSGLHIKGAESKAAMADNVPDEGYRIKHGRIRQSVMGWCFKPMKMEKLIAACKKMGMPAMEGINEKFYPTLRKLGMDVAITGSHGFKKGPVSRENHALVIQKLKERIDLCAKYGFKNVITFTGMRSRGMTNARGAKNCIEAWKAVMSHAEKKKVNLCLEHLNTRDSTHPMKGHPGYFGDDVDFCVDMIKKVASERMKLLFDVYHVQIMNGDVIRRIREYKDLIGHYHTAGNPGRGELDDTQEINYPAVMRTILATGYKGYVAQEFIPTWKDKLGALRHAVNLCDV